MQNFFAKSAGVSFKIWFFALFANTAIGSFLLGGFSNDYFMYFLWGAMFGGIASLPILFILLILIYFLFTNRTEYQKIISWLFMIGILSSLISFLCFTFCWGYNIGNVFMLCVCAIISAIIGIVTQIQTIKKICKKMEDESMIETPSSN